ncbi:hypothetical protein SAMN05421666_1044 [Roseovarius nanhaiticus]|uniref:Beta-barrel assembly machine subunit BamF n=2 Tax=Roseovarius nanhaiticus TaxID=573024 RepID=A0A1N7FHC9_9RHOB|nr:hypothetical protein SAMN05216208_1092 [Roseovarius nanhaiticus]SIR99731.1 hypothetical protein SAMN05421666_1044 [Roseovarius nanhaiticus]
MTLMHPLPLRARPLARITLAAALGLLAQAGCTAFPDVGDSASDAALARPYPDLVPLQDLDMGLGTSRIAPETAPAIEARVARLKDRADSLRRGAVVDGATRSRMRAGVDRSQTQPSPDDEDAQ